LGHTGFSIARIGYQKLRDRMMRINNDANAHSNERYLDDVTPCFQAMGITSRCIRGNNSAALQ
jgi:hypothetical protein